MGHRVVMTEAQFAVTAHAAESKSLGRCDQWRHRPPPPHPAQIDKPGRTQKIDITRDSGAAGEAAARAVFSRPF